jgi:hypothetical protein
MASPQVNQHQQFRFKNMSKQKQIVWIQLDNKMEKFNLKIKIFKIRTNN